jgi:hypothetical protein
MDAQGRFAAPGIRRGAADRQVARRGGRAVKPQLLARLLWIAALALNAIVLLPWLLFFDRDLHWSEAAGGWYVGLTDDWPNTLVAVSVASVISIWLVGMTLLGLCFVMHPRWRRVGAVLAIAGSAILTLPLVGGFVNWTLLIANANSLLDAIFGGVVVGLIIFFVWLPGWTVPPITLASVLLIVRQRGKTPYEERRPEACPKCGYRIGPSQWRFCPECGAPRPAWVSEPRLRRFMRLGFRITIWTLAGFNLCYMLLVWLHRMASPV